MDDQNIEWLHENGNVERIIPGVCHKNGESLVSVFASFFFLFCLWFNIQGALYFFGSFLCRQSKNSLSIYSKYMHVWKEVLFFFLFCKQCILISIFSFFFFWVIHPILYQKKRAMPSSWTTEFYIIYYVSFNVWQDNYHEALNSWWWI